jgi:NAD-dependent SIR2 family protein deacetylase
MECGCYNCLQVFPGMEIIDWIDDGDTPVCPHCGMATVLVGETNLTRLWELRHRRFGSEPLLGGG